MGKSKTNGWYEPSNLIAAVAAILALISLVVSIRGCRVADRSLELSTAEFVSQRSLILDGTVASNGNSIQLRSQDPATVLQQATALFPSELNKSEWSILPPERDLPVALLRFSLQRFLEKTVPRESGFVKVALEANVPVEVTSLFTTKGQAFEDRSLYRLMFSFLLNGDNNAPPEITYKGFVFVEHLADGTDVRRAVDQAWEDALKLSPLGKERPK